MSDQIVRSALLPPSQTRLEATLANAAALPLHPERIATLWNAQTCPVELLPWLAWTLSVDEWDDAWTEARKRFAVLQSVELHKKKGTPWAVLRALEVHGYSGCELVEYAGYQQAWQEAGGLYMDGAWSMDSRYMAAHLAQGSAVLRGAVLNHWAQYAIRVNAAEELWSRSAQRAIASIAKRYAPARSHLVALVGLLRWGFAMPSGMSSTIRLRAKFDGCSRLSSSRLPTMDGCWLMDADKSPSAMDGSMFMDGLSFMHTGYTGQRMEGGHIQLSQRIKLAFQFSACGERARIRTMSKACQRMNGSLVMDRHTFTGAMAMGDGHSMAGAKFGGLGWQRMDGTEGMGASHSHDRIAMRGCVTLRNKGQVTKEQFL